MHLHFRKINLSISSKYKVLQMPSCYCEPELQSFRGHCTFSFWVTWSIGCQDYIIFYETVQSKFIRIPNCVSNLLLMLTTAWFLSRQTFGFVLIEKLEILFQFNIFWDTFDLSDPLWQVFMPFAKGNKVAFNSLWYLYSISIKPSENIMLLQIQLQFSS